MACKYKLKDSDQWFKSKEALATHLNKTPTLQTAIDEAAQITDTLPDGQISTTIAEGEPQGIQAPVDVTTGTGEVIGKQSDDLKESERVVYDREPTAEDGVYKILGDPNNTIYRVNPNTGRIQEYSDGLWSNTASNAIARGTARKEGFQKIKDPSAKTEQSNEAEKTEVTATTEGGENMREANSQEPNEIFTQVDDAINKTGLVEGGKGGAEPPMGGTAKDEQEGKRRKASRAKRIEAEHNQTYKDMLDDYVSMYESVNMEAAKDLAQGYYIELQKRIASGELTQEQAQSDVFDYVNELLEEDSRATRATEKDHPLHKTAFAMMLGQRMLAEAISLGQSQQATTWNNFFQKIGKESGTRAAMLDATKSLDPLSNLLSEIQVAQQKELEKKAKSGRKKQTILNEIQEETQKANQEASEEAVDKPTVENAIDKATEEKPPVENKKKPSKSAELAKREKSAIDRVKKAFSAKTAPGPLAVVTPENKERIAALKELAQVEIEKGAYSLGEVVASIFKKVGEYVSKRAIREAVESEWSELSSLAENQKRADLTEMVKDAIAGKSTDKILQALGKAIKMAHPEYIKARIKGKKVTEAKAIEEILSNPEEAKNILTQALQILRTEVMSGKHLELAGGQKPSSLSQEQWDSARGKKVISMFEQMVDSVIGDAQQRSDEKERRKDIKQIIKDYYNTPNTAQSLQEFIAERSPNLTMQQINDIAAAVEAEMDKIKKSRDNAKIKTLVREITDGREDSDLTNIVGRVMKTRGMMSQFGFANVMSQFLGYKGVSQQHIQQMVALMQTASQMRPGQGRQGVIQAANNIAAFYSQSNLRVLNDVMQEVMVRNILSAPRTMLTGGFSVFILSAPALIKSFAIRPVKTYRGVRHAWSNAKEGRSAVRASLRETFGEHKIPVSRELPADDNTFGKERAWQRVREMTFKEVRNLWKQDKKKSITYMAAKMLIHLSLQGKGTGLTNFIFDLQTALDYLNVTALRDIYASIQAERDLEAKGIFSKDPQFAQEMADMLGTSAAKQANIETQINDEVADMVSNGVPVPKDYVKKRRRQLLNENTDLSVLEKSHEKAVESIGMAEPTSAVGSMAYYIISKITLANELKNDTLNIAGFAYARLVQPVALFSRMALVLGEKSARYAPLIGPFMAMLPVKFTTKKEGGASGFPMLKRDKDGNVRYTHIEDTREYAARLAISTTLTVAILMFLAGAYDDEEILDEKGKPVPDPENPGKNLTRRTYMYSEWIDFYGSNQKVSPEQRGVQPINSIRVKTGTNPDGTPKYDYWSFSWFPVQLYGSLKMMGEQRDKERFFGDRVQYEMNDKKEMYKTLREMEAFTPSDVAASAALNSFNFEFSNITKLVQQTSRSDGQAIFNTLLINPGKAQVSSETAEAIEDEIYRMMDRHKIYVNSKADGNTAAYLMNDIWFSDPFIQDRKDFESLDPFGNPIDFPGFVKFVPSLFSNNVFYGMADHENKNKKYYEVYYDDKGVYNPSELSLPKRYTFTSATDEMGVTGYGEDRNVQRKISDDQAKIFGELIRKHHDAIMTYKYEDRKPLLDYIHKVSIYNAIDANIKDHNRTFPTKGESKNKKMEKLMEAVSIRRFND